MDADLQNDPRDIPFLLKKLGEGYDLVCGWRRDRKDPWISRNLPSKVANWLIRTVIGTGIHDTGCSLKAYRGELVKMLRLYSDMHRFIAAVSEMRGARIGELVVTHRPRKHGASKYGLSRTFKVLSDLVTMRLITRFGSKPLLGFFTLALPLGLSGFSLLLFVLWNRLGSSPQPMRVVNETIALLLIATWCFLLLLGLIGEMALNATRAPRKNGGQLVFEEVRDGH
jgi:hypothetical protein